MRTEKGTSRHAGNAGIESGRGHGPFSLYLFNIYYIFTVAEKGEPAGLNYSEIDMSLSGGLGDITTIKNIPAKQSFT